MKHFKPEEFQGFYHDLSVVLCEKIDLTRERWGKPIHVSKAPGAVGRHLGIYDTSQHNIDRWHEVRALDVMPEGLESAYEVGQFFELAKEIGFTGIGFYPNWKPLPGFHLDVRPGKLATWGRIDGKHYVSIIEAFESIA